MVEAKDRLEREQWKRAAEEKRREKEEERLARQRVREEIARDKAEREAAAAARRAAAAGVAPAVAGASSAPAASSPSASSAPAAKKDYSECRLQIRLPTGQPQKATFAPSDPLSKVYAFVQDKLGAGFGPFSLLTPRPRRVFTPAELSLTLEQAGQSQSRDFCSTSFSFHTISVWPPL